MLSVGGAFNASWITLPLLWLFCNFRLKSCLPESGQGSADELRLVKKLFDGYNELIRPVHNMSEKLEVSFQLALHQLIHVDERNQILKSNVWLRMVWYDYQLHWDPAEYGGITVIRIQPEKVWKPDIVLFNNADGKYEVSFKPNVVIYDSGRVLWIPPAIYKSSCEIDVEYFPFDEQNCFMNFGSWTFNSEQVVLNYYEDKQKVDIEEYSPSGSWDLMACPGVIKQQRKDENHNISIASYKLTIRRKTLFYTINLIVPCVLITFLSVSVFYLPADGVQKMTLCISILLALVVFLVLVSKILPATSNTVPLISKYLLFAFIINIFTILLTVIIINWNFRSPRSHPMPRWVRVVFLNYLPRLIFMKRPRHDERLGKKAYTLRHERLPGGAGKSRHGFCCSGKVHSADETKESGGAPARNGHCRLTPDEPPVLYTEFDSRAPSIPGEGRGWLGGHQGEEVREEVSIPLTRETHRAMEAVRYIAAQLRNEDDFSEILDDWRYVASTVDRLMLIIFVLITFGGTIGILINAPHIYESVNQDQVLELIRESDYGYGYRPEEPRKGPLLPI